MVESGIIRIFKKILIMKKIQTKFKNCLKAVFSRIEEIVLIKRISFVVGRFQNFVHFFVSFSVTHLMYQSSTFHSLLKSSLNWTKIFKSEVFIVVGKKVNSHQRKSHRSLVIGNQRKKQNQKSIIFSKKSLTDYC